MSWPGDHAPAYLSRGRGSRRFCPAPRPVGRCTECQRVCLGVAAKPLLRVAPPRAAAPGAQYALAADRLCRAFNRRHRRSGHLFQNRYKSIVCEEEVYFLELIRYLHLNPVRAGIVRSLGARAGIAYLWVEWLGRGGATIARMEKPEEIAGIIAEYFRTQRVG